MVSVIKVTAFSYNYRDGKLLSTPLLLTPYWQKYAVATMPTLFEFVSYLFYFPTFLAGTIRSSTSSDGLTSPPELSI